MPRARNTSDKPYVLNTDSELSRAKGSRVFEESAARRAKQQRFESEETQALRRTFEDNTRTQKGLKKIESLPLGSGFNHYFDKCGRTGIDSTKMDKGYIQVKFKDGSEYIYDTSRLSDYMIQKMQTLANDNEGLNRFINTSKAKFLYSEKMR